MAVITINVIVSNLETVQRTFDQIKVYRSVTGIDGAYTESTGPGTRLAIETGKSVYAYTDLAGASSYYYKSSYFHAVSLLESSLSAAQQGEGDFALDIVSVQELRTNYLFGLDTTDDSGNEMPDSMFEWFIKSAVSWAEHRLQIALRPKPITAELHDFFAEDCRQYVFLKTKEYPIIDVSEMRFVIPGVGGSVLQIFDRASLQLEKEAGHVQVVTGSMSAGLVAGMPWLPFQYNARRFIPGAFQLDYTAGFATEDLPMMLRDVIAKVASFGLLNPMGDLIGGAGIASSNISIDGLSQGISTTSSATNAGYGSRIIQYEKEIKRAIPVLETYYKGLRLVIA